MAFWTLKYFPRRRPCAADSFGSRRGGGVWRWSDREKPIFITRKKEYSIKSAVRWLLGASPFRHPFPSAIHDHHHQYRPIIYRPFIQADPIAWWHKGGIPGPHLRGLRPVLTPCPINVLAINWLPVNFVLAASPARKSLKKAPQTSVQGRLWFICISQEFGVPMRNKIYKNKQKSCEHRSWHNARRSPEEEKNKINPRLIRLKCKSPSNVDSAISYCDKCRIKISLCHWLLVRILNICYCYSLKYFCGVL